MRKKGMALVMAAVLLLLTACGQTETAKTIKEVKQNPEAAPQTMAVKRMDIANENLYESRVTYEVHHLAFPETGTFGSYSVALGDYVTEGQVLAVAETQGSQKTYDSLKKRLDNYDDNYEYNTEIAGIEIESLKLQLKMAEEALGSLTVGTYQFTQACMKIGRLDRSIAQKELSLKQLGETYKLERPHLYAQVKESKDKLGSNVIVAPCNGYVVAVNSNAAQGSYIQDGAYYIAVADDSSLVMSCDFTNTPLLTFFSRIYAFVDSYEYELEYVEPDEELYTRVYTGEQTQYSTFKILNPDSHVSAGKYGFVVMAKTEISDCLAVPTVSILVDLSGRFVYVKSPNGKEKRYVKTGISDGAYTEILEGLEEGEEVYVED